MDINDKLINDLADQLGLGHSASKADRMSDLADQLGLGHSVSKADRMSDLADKYKGKSDQELIDEIMKVKHTLKKNKGQYEKQLAAIKAMRSMMSGEQKARLDKLIRLLEADD